MKSNITAALLASAIFCTPAFAQEAAPAVQTAPVEVPAVQVAAPVEVAPVAAAPVEARLPAGTEVVVSLNNALSSRDARMGDNFPLTVARDVTVDGRVVVPAGTRAVGQVTWRSGRGSFGSSGKLEVAVRYIDYNEMRIPLDGFHRQEGESRTGSTIGAVAAAGVIGGMLVKGKNAHIPEGFEITALTADPIPVLVPADGPAVIAASYSPSAVNNQTGRRRNARPETAEQPARRNRRS